jgi:hypothetical protein
MRATFKPLLLAISYKNLSNGFTDTEVVCSKCQSQLHLIAPIKTGDVAKKSLTAMHVVAEVPELHLARPPPREVGGDEWLN